MPAYFGQRWNARRRGTRLPLLLPLLTLLLRGSSVGAADDYRRRGWSGPTRSSPLQRPSVSPRGRLPFSRAVRKLSCWSWHQANKVVGGLSGPDPFFLVKGSVSPLPFFFSSCNLISMTRLAHYVCSPLLPSYRINNQEGVGALSGKRWVASGGAVLHRESGSPLISCFSSSGRGIDARLSHLAVLGILLVAAQPSLGRTDRGGGFQHPGGRDEDGEV